MQADIPPLNSDKKERLPDPQVKQARSPVPRQLLKIFKQSKIPIYFLDANDRILFANQALHECLGLERDYLTGLECSSQAVTQDNQVIQLASQLAITTRSRCQATHVEPFQASQSRENYSARLILPLNPERQDGSLMVIWLKPEDTLWRLANESLDWTNQQAEFQAMMMAFQAHAKAENHPALIGISPSTRKLQQQFQAAISGSMPVCIFGPSGSGKVQLAKLIHRQRLRANPSSHCSELPWIVDCRLMDQSLLASMIEMNEERYRDDRTPFLTPTLLLIQIEELPEQAHRILADYLLRKKPLTIATTSCDCLLAVFPQSKAWQSIVASIDILPLQIQALAERLEDILPCAETLAEQLQANAPTNMRKTFSPTCRRLLQAYPWPENLDELTASIEFAIKNCKGQDLEPEHFPISIQTFASHILRPKTIEPIELDRAMEAFERSLFTQAMEAFPKNRAAAARHLGISRARFLRRLVQLGFEPETTEDKDQNKTKEKISKGSKDSDSLPEAASDLQDPDLPVFEEIQD